MFQHFTFKPLLSKKRRRRNYQFSFFYKGTYYKGLYHFYGEIEWHDPVPSEENQGKFETQIHELMLFHVYDK